MSEKITRALLSVSDKEGIVELGKFLAGQGVEILSTGGTAHKLTEAGVPVIEVSDYTGFPEMMDGRVKTLHPKIHGGLLALRSNPSHVEAMNAHNIGGIDLVVVNLYPFEETIAKEGCAFEDAIENIDIGGPTMLRSAAKNHAHVTVVVEPGDYGRLMDEMKSGSTSAQFRFECARKVFSHTAAYDSAISNYLTARESADAEPVQFPGALNLNFIKKQDLRYGENPHQSGAFYVERAPSEPSIALARQLHGKELSYNNILDTNAALELVKEFAETAAIVVKHTNPCGAALGSSIAEAYEKARATDPVSAFGGIVALNRPVDMATADLLAETFLEVVIAPSYEKDALAKLQEKKNIRLLELPFEGGTYSELPRGTAGWELRRVVGGLLVQELDRGDAPRSDWKVVTKRAPSEEEMRALAFAWTCGKHVKSNAIVYAREGQLVGVGAGQMSRVDSARVGVEKAQLPIKGTVVASDAFFPFRDGLDQLAEAGAVAVIQPGGSVRDEEVIAAADEHGMAMVFTGYRHFRH